MAGVFVTTAEAAPRLAVLTALFGTPVKHNNAD